MRGLTAAFALLLLACATPADRGSPTYQAGFGDGCATASAEGGAIRRPPQRNEALYAEDPGYRSGWVSGHAACRTMGGPPRL